MIAFLAVVTAGVISVICCLVCYFKHSLKLFSIFRECSLEIRKCELIIKLKLSSITLKN